MDIICICLRKPLYYSNKTNLGISFVVSEIEVDLFFTVSSTKNRLYFEPTSFCRSVADQAVKQTAENLVEVIFGNVEKTSCLRRVHTM